MFRRVQQEDETGEGMFEIKEMKVRVWDSDEVKQPMSVSPVKYTPPPPSTRLAALTSYSHRLGKYDLYWIQINTGVET